MAERNPKQARIRRIRRHITPVIEPAEYRGSEKRNYEFTHPNGRAFAIREQVDGTFFLEEFRPNGRLCEFDETKPANSRFWDDPRVKDAAQDSPNGFLARISALGIDNETIVRCGAGYGVYSRYHDSLDACAEAIDEAIEGDQWYEACDVARMNDPEEQARQEAEEREGRRAYRAEQRRRHQVARSAEHGIFRGLYSMMGPLDEDVKRAVLSYLNAPSEAGWGAIHGYCIKGCTTLWQAWTHVDPQAPRSKGERWPRIPEPEVLREAMRRLGEREPGATLGADTGGPRSEP